ncbi:MAG: SDR family oxidoreductase [Thermodesulfobacteriota bacterium]
MKNFNGKKAYIVGGSSGIGLAAAGLLAAQGADVVIFARGRERLEKALASISATRMREDQRFSAKRLDVSRHEETFFVLSETAAEFGPPDLLVNSAGRALPRRFEDVTYAQFKETLEINLGGVWNAVAALLPHLKETGGHIVNVSSVAGFIGVFGYTDYCASKFGVIGFSEALRSELKPLGINVSVLCPPDTDTPGFEQENRTKPEETRAVSGRVKLKTPEQVARAMLEGVRRNRFMIIPGFDARLTFIAKRLFPGLVSLVMDRTIRKARQK